MIGESVPAGKYLRYGAQLAGTYLLLGFFRLLPVETASYLGGKWMEAFGTRTGKHRKIVLPQLRGVFPDKREDEIAQIARATWNNLGRVTAEYAHLRSMWKRLEIVGAENMVNARNSGRPVVFFTGHLGNWELCSIGAKQHDLPLHVVYRKPNNLWVDHLLRRARNVGAAGQIEKGTPGAREIVNLLRRNGAVGMLIDQRLTHGRLIPFLGKPAWTAEGAAQFTLKFDCLLLPARIERLQGAKFRMTVLPPMDVVQTGDREADGDVLLTRMNDLLSAWIMEKPDQWLWTHRRWRYTPEDPCVTHAEKA